MGWPGLSVADDGMKIDPDVLEDAAALLQMELDGLTGQAPGSVDDLSARGNVPQGAFGDWTTGREMYNGYVTAHGNTVEYYGRLIGQLERAIGLLRTTAAEQRGTDESAQQTFNAQNEALAATPDSTVTVA